jgi:transcription initiation factor TFIIH subunit 1
MPSSMLADIKPVTDHSQINFTITPDIIRAIFIQYPTVKKAYDENVPDKVGFKEFI